MNQIARIHPTNAVTAWTSRQLDTIRRTVAKDTNDDEFNLFIEYARVKGLGIRLDLYRRVGRFNTFCSHGWQLAWDRNPDLHARRTELFRQRGELQQIRDAEIDRAYRAEQRRARRSYRKAA